MSRQLRITFDTNTLGPLVEAFRAQSNGNSALFAGAAEAVILLAVQSGEILPRAAETVLTLEGVQRKDRVVYFGGYKAKVSAARSEEPNADGVIKLSLTIGGGTSPPTLNQMQLDRLNDFVSLGGRFFMIPRLGGVPRPQTITNALVTCTAEELMACTERSGELSRKIENAKAGINQAKALAKRLDPHVVPWINAFMNAISPQDEQAVGDAIAEWADGDLIAGHYGYGNEILCTNDKAGGAGSSSVMSAANRAWLTRDYGVQFMTLEELAREKPWK